MITVPQISGLIRTINIWYLDSLINLALYLTTMEIEPVISLIYLATGFIGTYLSLEVAWHFTACKIKTTSENGVKPCLFKQVRLVTFAAARNTPSKSP